MLVYQRVLDLLDQVELNGIEIHCYHPCWLVNFRSSHNGFVRMDEYDSSLKSIPDGSRFNPS